MGTIHATLLYIVKDGKVLLGEKLRGWRQGIFNGIGGKIEGTETIEETMIRETIEEIGVTPTKYEKVAIHYFGVYFKNEPTDLICHTYIATEYKGTPQESHEMKPQWFAFDDIPYDRMWSGDPLWLPRVLDGEKVITHIEFDAENNIVSHNIETVTTFPE